MTYSNTISLSLLVLLPTINAIFTTESNLNRLRHYHRIDEIISHKKRSRRSTDDYYEFDDPLEHRSVEVTINNQIKWLDLVEKENRHELEHDCSLFNGVVRDEADSRVVLTLCSNSLMWHGIIYLNHETHILEPIQGTDHHVIYNEQDDTALTSRSRMKRNADEFDLTKDYTDEVPLSRSKRAMKKNRNKLNMKPRNSTPTERKLNVVIAMDYSMIEFHEPEESRYNMHDSPPSLTEKIKIYLVTMMSIVDSIYNDDSLQNKINISLVDIDPLTKKDSDNLIIEDDPAGTLTNVAERLDGRAQRFRQRRSNHRLNAFNGPSERDLTIFLTRREFGPAGYAPVGTICREEAYTINREDGFSSAFVIAHEVGHVLGMRHDGSDNECLDDPKLGSIMAPIVQAKIHQFTWSRCSNVELRNHINDYECLNKPIPRPSDKSAKSISFRGAKPDESGKRHFDKRNGGILVEKRVDGQEKGLYNYTLDQQCQYAFGPDHTWCNSFNTAVGDTGPQCMALWCSAVNNKQFCKSKHSAPLDGTPCEKPGIGKGYCYQTLCVVNPVGNGLPVKVDGHWGQWGEWEGDGRCSADCDTGTKIRRRQCVGRKNGGADCEGPSYDYQICNTHPCLNNLIDRRTFMCQRETGNSFMVPRIHRTNPNQCQLSCWDQKTHRLNSEINLWVDDGTPCSYDAPHGPMCIQGKCVAAGCTKETGSGAYNQGNKCGICTTDKGYGGDDDGCQHVSRSDKKKFKIKKGRKNQIKPSAHNITTIPAEAYNTQIVIPRLVNAKIAFIDTRTNFRYTLTKQYNQEVIGGTLVKYNAQLSKRARRTKAMFTITGRILHDIVIQVTPETKHKHRRSTLSIKWEFYIRKSILQDQQEGIWEKTGRWTACKAIKNQSRDCSNAYIEGSKKPILQCRVLSNNKIIRNKTEARKLCGNPPREKERLCRISNRENCKIVYDWKVQSQWSECSVSCGTDGIEHRDVFCVHLRTRQTVDDEKCLKAKPYDTRPCEKPKCPPTWNVGEWRECEPSMGKCGRGFNYRDVECTRGTHVITDQFCDQVKKPSTQRACEVKCSDECVQDQSVFCGVMYLKEYCRTDDFRKLCCDTCKKYIPARHDQLVDEEPNHRLSPLPGKSVSRYHTGYSPISPLDQDYEMNDDGDYEDIDIDESGTYLPDSHDHSRRYRRSVPKTLWTLEKLEELGREMMTSR